MENLLNKINDEFNSGFPEISDGKYNELNTNNDISNSKNVDIFCKNNFIDHPKVTHDILSEIKHFSNSNKDSFTKRNTFNESDLKYLLSKSPSEHDSKKSGKSKKETEEEEREKMQVLVSNFTEDQLDRYEMYRRAAFPKAAIKRIMQVITGNSVSQNVVIAMSGIAKVFVGEIVEEALDIMEAQKDAGPLQPKHLREAARRLRRKGKIPSLRDKKPNYRF